MGKTNDHLLSNETYDLIKKATQIFLPAIGTLYFALSQIWGLPYGAEIVGTIVAFETFLGVILGISTKSYNNSYEKYDGYIGLDHDGDGNRIASMQLTKVEDPEEILEQDEVLFKIEE